MRNVNIAYHDVARIIWESDGVWNYDDSNNSTGPVAYRTLGNASASYVIPTTALRIEAVEVKDNSGDWHKMTPLSLADFTISPEEYLSSPGMPAHYMLEGNEIRLIPPPGTSSVTMSSGMAVRLSRAVTELATTATTTEPGFAVPFHRILSFSAALDFVQDEQHRKFLAGQKARLENGLIRFYSKRASEYRTQVRPAGKKRWRNYT